MESIIQPGTEIFWEALLVVAGLGLVELVSVLLGVSASGLLDDGLGYHGPGDHDGGLLGGWMSWLNAGGVPLLVLAVILLSAFAIFGFILQAVAASVGGPMPALAAGVLSLVWAVPATRWLSRGVARIMPRDETSAISQDGFIGLLGTVTIGPLDQGQPGVHEVGGHGALGAPGRLVRQKQQDHAEKRGRPEESQGHLQIQRRPRTEGQG